MARTHGRFGLLMLAPTDSAQAQTVAATKSWTIDSQTDYADATAQGEPVSVSRHRPAVEVKGATFTALRVGRNEDGQWVAQTVVDV